jgi:Fur family transcriptional regulator, zinc uptake regulator
MTHDSKEALTRNQGLVLGALEGAHGPLSAYEILDRLRSEGLRAPLQIYRALDKLVERGLAHRLESLNAFVACADRHCHAGGTLAFAICTECGRVDEFSDHAVQARLEAWAQDADFHLNRTTIELRGQCKGCRTH